jgi:hypothetical protein
VNRPRQARRRRFARPVAGAVAFTLVTVLPHGGSGPWPAERAGGAAADPAAGPADSIVIRWNDVTVEAIRRSQLPPTAIARGLAIVHSCMYDAWAAYDGRAVPAQGGDLRRPKAEHSVKNQREAISHAAYQAAVDIFPGGRDELVDPLLGRLGYDPSDPATDPASPARVGKEACAAVLAFRHRDGANQLGDEPGGRPGVPYSDYTGYQPVNAPMDLREPFDPATVKDLNRWQPLTYVNASGELVTPSFLTPQWARVTPFALPSPGALRPQAGPVQAGTPAFEAQARRLVDLSAGLTDEHKVIVRYWAAGPRNEYAPGQWSIFARHLARRDGHGAGRPGIERDVKMFFVLAQAISDATVASWDAKIHFDSVRPITAIRALFAGQRIRAWAGPGKGTSEIDGAEWFPYHPPTLPSPPFAEYTAGHSALGAAGAEALRLFTGRDALGYSETIPAGTSGYEPGIPADDVTLSWATLTDAVNQEGLSRLYAGVHFPAADTDGQAQGRRAAAAVWEKAQALFAGRGPRPAGAFPPMR